MIQRHLIGRLFLALAFCLFPALALPAGEEAPAVPAAAPAPGEAGEAAATPAAGEEEEEEDPEAEKIRIMTALREQARRYFVLVRIEVARDLEATDERPEDRLVEQLVTLERRLELSGVLLEGGLVLVPELGLRDSHYRSIAVVPDGGEPIPAERLGLLVDVPGTLLRLDPAAGEAPPGLAAPEPAGEITPFASWYLSQYRRMDADWGYGFGRPPLPSYIELPEAGEQACLFRFPVMGRFSFESGGGPTLIFDDEGRPVGVGLGGTIFANPEHGVAWRIGDLLAGERLTQDELAATETAVKERLGASLYEMTITFWQERGEQYASPMERAMIMDFGQDFSQVGREEKVYGLAISPDTIFLPVEMPREAVERIEEVSVAVPEGEPLAAEFAGVFRGFGGVLFRLRGEGRLERFLAVREGVRLPDTEPVFSVRARRQFEQLDLLLRLNRVLEYALGAHDRRHPTLCREAGTGSIIVDREGSLLGFVMNEKMEGEEARRAAAGEQRYYHPSFGGGQQRIFAAAELAPVLAAPDEHFDPDIRPRQRLEARRPMWLGVEYSRVNRSLAKLLDCLEPTQDGRRGLIVTHVYPGSPAASMGLVRGDILLRLEREGEDPLDLAFGGARGMYYGAGFSDVFNTGDVSYEFRLPFTPRSQNNPLNELLAQIGEGEPIVFEVLKDEEVIRLGTMVEQSPPTFQSAPRYRNEDIGLTVRDLTYEVRFLMRLAPDESGVVVTRVDSGTPASIARIAPWFLITRVDDLDIESAASFEAAIESRRAAGQERARVVLKILDETRIIDLGLQRIGGAEAGEEPLPPELQP